MQNAHHHKIEVYPFKLKIGEKPVVLIGNSLNNIEFLEHISKYLQNGKISVYSLDQPLNLDTIDVPDTARISYFNEKPTEEELILASFIIISKLDEETEKWVANIAKKQNIPLHISGNKELSDFMMIGSEAAISLKKTSTEYEIYSEKIEKLSKINKSVQRRANVYLGLIGLFVFIGLFAFIIFEFNLIEDINHFLIQDNHLFYKMLAAGFFAEIVAGSMGMGYGVLCTTILLMLNIAPPIVSASIHSAESFTSAAGSFSHFKLKNVNLKLVKNLAPTAILGAIIGAFALSYFGEHYAHIVKPIISVYTLYLGINILKKVIKTKKKLERKKKSNLRVLGLVGGFIDSFAGGGWGPLVTGSLMSEGRTPRFVVGSSTLTKFILTFTSALTFIFTLGIQHWNVVLGLLIGGIITAPFSAILTSKIPVKLMFWVISILIIILSSMSIIKAIF